MSATVNTGWRNVTPGKCLNCGCDDDWECDGRGHITCSCQSCPSCGCAEGHWQGCEEARYSGDTDEV